MVEQQKKQVGIGGVGFNENICINDHDDDSGGQVGAAAERRPQDDEQKDQVGTREGVEGFQGVAQTGDEAFETRGRTYSQSKPRKTYVILWVF